MRPLYALDPSTVCRARNEGLPSREIVSMDAVPADLISRLEVVKALRPDMDANAIGASINIETLSAFDLPGGFLFGSLRSGYNDLSGRAPFSGSASIGRVFGDQRWGVVVGGSYSRRRYESELFRVADSWGNYNGQFVPQNQAFFLYELNRRRQGVNASVEYRPAKQQAVTFQLNHNRFEDTEGRQQTALDLTRGTLTNQTPTAGQFSQGRATREFRDYNQQHLMNAAMLSGTHESARTAFDWSVGADLKMNFADEKSAVVGVEFTNSSITSGGDGSEVGPAWERLRQHNPHLRFHNNRRGYVACTATNASMRAEFRIVDRVSMPGGAGHTAGALVVEAGRTGATRD